MRSYLNFAALVGLFAIAGWWFATHPPVPRAPEAGPISSPKPALTVDAGARAVDAGR